MSPQRAVADRVLSRDAFTMLPIAPQIALAADNPAASSWYQFSGGICVTTPCGLLESDQPAASSTACHPKSLARREAHPYTLASPTLDITRSPSLTTKHPSPPSPTPTLPMPKPAILSHLHSDHHGSNTHSSSPPVPPTVLGPTLSSPQTHVQPHTRPASPPTHA